MKSQSTYPLRLPRSVKAEVERLDCRALDRAPPLPHRSPGKQDGGRGPNIVSAIPAGSILSPSGA